MKKMALPATLAHLRTQLLTAAMKETPIPRQIQALKLPETQLILRQTRQTPLLPPTRVIPTANRTVTTKNAEATVAAEYAECAVKAKDAT